MMKVVRYRVDMVEYERGWGSLVDEHRYFDSMSKAQEFVKTYNQTHLSLTHTPDWYIKAMAPIEVIEPLADQEAVEFFKSVAFDNQHLLDPEEELVWNSFAIGFFTALGYKAARAKELAQRAEAICEGYDLPDGENESN